MKPEPAIFEDAAPDAEMAADAEGLADLDAGRVVSHEAMKAWLETWGSPTEASPPKVGD